MWMRMAWLPCWPDKRSAGVAPEVNFREHTSYKPPSFGTKERHHQKSKTEVLSPLKMTYNHLKNVLKKIDANISEAGDDAEAISRCMGQGKY